ncbi:hypothetical protein ABZ897_39085 [Nonomuraea sp. NPDC046802]|uniref:hypothetical protein n=1 Tax=Nonomuraea sp. NPDC046802 TaxID=3154919 RepID=UPI0033E9395C
MAAAVKVVPSLVAAQADDGSGELNEEATGIQLTYDPDSASITVPFWYSGEAARDTIDRMYTLGRIVEDVTGMEGHDPQLGLPLTEALSNLDAAVAVFDQVADMLSYTGLGHSTEAPPQETTADGVLDPEALEMARAAVDAAASDLADESAIGTQLWVADGDPSAARLSTITLPENTSMTAAYSPALFGAGGRFTAVAWPGSWPHNDLGQQAVFVAIHENGRTTGVRLAQVFTRHDDGFVSDGDLVAAPTPDLPNSVAEPWPDERAWQADCHEVVCYLVEQLGGDPDALTRDPLTHLGMLDDWVVNLSPDDAADEWLVVPLANYFAEVLIHGYRGRWAVVPDPARPGLFRYVIHISDSHGDSRMVDVYGLVAEELRPVPQRLARILERVTTGLPR